MSTSIITPGCVGAVNADVVLFDHRGQPAGTRTYSPRAITLPTQINDVAEVPSIWSLESKVEWLIEDLIPLGSVNLITAESGTGKTWVAYAIAGTVARGQEFARRRVRQRPVLYLDGENPLCIAKQRLWDLGIEETPELRVWGGWLPESPPGPNNALLRQYAGNNRPLLIWDPLVQFHDGDEQHASETRKFMDGFRQLAHLGATILILHHTGKTSTSQEYRGSSDIKAAVDMAYLLETESNLDGGIYRLTLSNFKSRYAPGKSLGLEFVPRKGFIASEVRVEAALDPMEIVVDIVATNPGSNQSQIVSLAKQEGVSKHQVERCLTDARFECERGNRNEWLYTLNQLPNLPPPKERETGKLPAPAEVVA